MWLAGVSDVLTYARIDIAKIDEPFRQRACRAADIASQHAECHRPENAALVRPRPGKRRVRGLHDRRDLGYLFQGRSASGGNLGGRLLRLMTLPNIWPRAKPSLAFPIGHRQGRPQFASQLLRRRREETGRDAVRNTQEGLHADAGAVARSIMARNARSDRGGRTDGDGPRKGFGPLSASLVTAPAFCSLPAARRSSDRRRCRGRHDRTPSRRRDHYDAVMIEASLDRLLSIVVCMGVLESVLLAWHLLSPRKPGSRQEGEMDANCKT